MTTTPCAIATDQAPAAIGPYSQAVRAGNFVYVSGQIPINPAIGKIEATDVVGQAAQVITNLAAILAAAGLGLGNVVKTTVYLTDIADFAAVNEVYASRFTTSPLPARAAFQVVALPAGAKVEIEAVAYDPRV
ncbi:MAG: Rid family detoxifying hydrolase [Propionibacteriaceae bacterium]|jgi:2-iminobutanoate/2-iminopropanoate deaminase|nr:Rid family detoxifying hydrolase [Propionibacteriaceae bacterium]